MKEILLKQHIGSPAKAVVKPGDRVRRGSLLAVPEGLGANVHSSVDGLVKEVKEDRILVEETAEQEEGFQPISGEDILSLIREAGIVGMGGAGFPTAKKLNIDLKGGYLLVNAAECEPLLMHNMRQILEQPEKTLRGINYAMQSCKAAKAVIAIKKKHEEEINLLLRTLPDFPNITLHLLPDLYPMGEERAVVREVLGILLPPTALPSEAGAVVINVETCLRIAEAVEEKKPSFLKNITVAGKLKKGKESQVFMDIPVGTTVGELITMAGGIDGEYGEILLGGPFTGTAVSLSTPITKTSGGILVTEPFPDLKGAKTGVLICACGGNMDRMEDLCKKYNATLTAVQACKQAVDVRGTLKCENPGNCPGQAAKILHFKNKGCTDILIGNCSDCTNTVMGSAPKMNLTVHHQTDHVLKTVGMEPMRYLTKSKTVEQLPVNEEGRQIPFPKEEKKQGSSGGDGERRDSGTLDKKEEQKLGTEAFIEEGLFHIRIEEGQDIHIEFS